MRTRSKITIFSLIACLLFVSCSSKKDNKEDVVETAEPQETRVSFVGVGDNLIHDTVYNDAVQADGSYDFSKMYEQVKPKIQSSDIAFINQETILGGSELGLSGYPQFNSPIEIAKNLEDTGFNLVNMATNHSLDRGSEVIANATSAFSKTKMVYSGVANSVEESKQIKTFEKKGITFSFLAYTYGTNGIVADHEYNVSYFNDEKIRSDVAKAKEVSDVVIVSAHWGDENTFVASSFQTHYADLFTELGVDVVVGTHTHTIQPLEWKENEEGHKTLIIYSLGNFLGGMLSLENVVGGMVSFDFVRKDKEIVIENVKWNTVVIHYELKGPNMMSDRYRYQVFMLNEYSDERSSKHALNGYEGQVVNMQTITNIVNSVIAEEYR